MRKEFKMLITAFAMIIFAGCAGPSYTEPEMVAAEPPTVSYDFTSDEDLIEANREARSYCLKYEAIPRVKEPITDNPDGTKTVTFECIETAEVSGTMTSQPPKSYIYTTNAELLEAIRSADAYCARTHQVASTSITTNPDGTKTMTFECVPR